MKQNTLRPTAGSRKQAKRLGRGRSSGHGGTSTRGHKGQKARSGAGGKRGFEGGQMPLVRRLPKRGFTNQFAQKPAIINLEQLVDWPNDEEVNIDNLVVRGLVSGRNAGVKLLARGEVDRKLSVKLSAVSEAARRKIEAASGKIELDATA